MLGLVPHSYVLKLRDGEPGEPAVFVSDWSSWSSGDQFAARDGSRWRIVEVEPISPLLADEGFEATWVVEPLD